MSGYVSIAKYGSVNIGPVFCAVFVFLMSLCLTSGTGEEGGEEELDLGYCMRYMMS